MDTNIIIIFGVNEPHVLKLKSHSLIQRFVKSLWFFCVFYPICDIPNLDVLKFALHKLEQIIEN